MTIGYEIDTPIFVNKTFSITCIHLIAVTSKNVLVTHKGNAKHVECGKEMKQIGQETYQCSSGHIRILHGNNNGD